MAIKIEKDIPIPTTSPEGGLYDQIVEALGVMDVGDSFSLEGTKACQTAEFLVGVANRGSRLEGLAVTGKIFMFKKYTQATYRLFRPNERIQACRVWRVS